MALTIDDKPRAGKAFLDPAAPTLAAVIAALDPAEPDPRRRGELASGIRTVCRVLGHLPHELPADTALLGRLIRKAVPAAAGVSPSRWANARSLLAAAMALTGLRIMPGRRLYPLGAAWSMPASSPSPASAVRCASPRPTWPPTCAVPASGRCDAQINPAQPLAWCL